MDNKKGAIATGLTAILLYLGFVILIIIFFFLFKFVLGQNEVKILGHVDNMDNNLVLANYLRTPYKLDERMSSIGEMLSIYENEYDNSLKNKHFMEIEKITKEILNPLENCYTKPGLTDKFISGYSIIILDKETYNDHSKLIDYAGSSLKIDRKFRSDNFFDSSIDKDKSAFAAIPSIDGSVIYIGFFRTGKNVFLGDSSIRNVRGCS